METVIKRSLRVGTYVLIVTAAAIFAFLVNSRSVRADAPLGGDGGGAQQCYDPRTGTGSFIYGMCGPDQGDEGAPGEAGEAGESGEDGCDGGGGGGGGYGE